MMVNPSKAVDWWQSGGYDESDASCTSCASQAGGGGDTVLENCKHERPNRNIHVLFLY